MHSVQRHDMFRWESGVASIFVCGQCYMVILEVLESEEGEIAVVGCGCEIK